MPTPLMSLLHNNSPINGFSNEMETKDDLALPRLITNEIQKSKSYFARQVDPITPLNQQIVMPIEHKRDSYKDLELRWIYIS